MSDEPVPTPATPPAVAPPPPPKAAAAPAAPKEPEVPAGPSAKVVATLAGGAKVKIRLPRMRACDERNEKGKICAGHLKRWFNLTAEVQEKYGKNAELYRCERCHSIYLPNPEETPRSGTLSY